jgi:hypothetical protein
MLSPALTRTLLSVSLGAAAIALVAGVAASAAADEDIRAASASGSYEARLAGAATATLRGAVDLGSPAGSPHPGTFVLTLGAYSDDGALLFSRWDGKQPGPGTYPITPDPSTDGFTALVVTGPPTRPGGAFRAQRGTLTITHSSPDGLAGRFELQARGFRIDDQREDHELAVRGSFTSASAIGAAIE